MSPNDSVDQSDTESGSVETNTTLDEEGPSTDTIDDEHVSSANDEIENKSRDRNSRNTIYVESLSKIK